jgi:hypothetical protein
MFESRKDRVVGLRGRTLVFYGTKRKECFFSSQNYIFMMLSQNYKFKPLHHENYTFYFGWVTKL